jgi:hypothetical protein
VEVFLIALQAAEVLEITSGKDEQPGNRRGHKKGGTHRSPRSVYYGRQGLIVPVFLIARKFAAPGRNQERRGRSITVVI